MQSSSFKMVEKFLLVALLICMSLTIIFAATDKTLEEKAVGADVVEAVDTKIRREKIFPEDYQFFRRLAYVESRDGTANTTFANNFYGGIWQVNERYFNLTKSRQLAPLHQKINASFQISWANVEWRDLLKPLYSGLAARLFVNETGRDIPQTIVEQGHFFNQVYNHRDDMDNSTFVIGVEELENNTATCSGKMDLVIVLDGSNSVGQENFELCKKFVVDLIGTFSLETVRHSFIVYSTVSEIVFGLDHGLTLQGLRSKTLEQVWPNERTDTNGALLKVLDVFDASTEREGVPQVMSIFTDGQSTSPGVDNIRYLQERNISSYVIGITNLVNLDELEQLAYNIQNNVFSLTNFQVLAEFFKRLNAETCKLPQKPQLDTPTQDVLNKGERRYYEFSVPPEGLTLAKVTEEGKTSGYYSFTEKNPTSALCDGELSWEGVFIDPSFTRSSTFAGEDEGPVVYVSVQGLDTFNNYTIEAVTGFAVQSTTTGLPDETTTPAAEEETTPDGSSSSLAVSEVADQSTTPGLPESESSTKDPGAEESTTPDGSGSSLVSSIALTFAILMSHYLLF